MKQMGIKRGSLVSAALVVTMLAAAPAASAFPIIFATSNDVLFRIDSDTLAVDTFTLSDDITAMSFDDNGVLWATSPRDMDADTFYDVYRISDPFGTPSLLPISDGLVLKTPSIDWVGSTLYGLQTYDTGGGVLSSKLVTIDPNTGNETVVGATGATGRVSGSIGVDVGSGVMYSIDHVDNNLYTLDWQLLGGPDPSSTLIGNTGYNPANTGLDYYDDTLYAMSMNNVSGNFDIGVFTVDTTTGAYTLLVDLSGETATRGSQSIAVIPEPATLCLLALGGIAVAMRRRR